MFTASLVASDRSSPEDAVRVVQTGAVTAFVVADGAGGIGGGARAAQLVVESFAAGIQNAAFAMPMQKSLCDFLRQLDQQLVGDAAAGESTAIIAVICDGVVTGASVGDSEAWMVTPKERTVLTAEQHKARLGSGRASPMGFEAVLVTEAVLVGATDGLFHAASAAAICGVLRDVPIPESLVALARSRSGKLYDDVGIVIVANNWMPPSSACD